MSLAEETAPLHRGPAHPAAMARFDAEWEDLREAATWLADRGDAQPCGRASRTRSGSTSGSAVTSPTAAAWVDAVFGSASELPPMLHGRLCFLSGGLTFEAGDYTPRSSCSTAASNCSNRRVTTRASPGPTTSERPHFPPSPPTTPTLHRRAARRTRSLSFRRRPVGPVLGPHQPGHAGRRRRRCRRGCRAPHRVPALAARLDDPSMLAQAHTQLGFTYLSGGQPDLAKASLVSAVAHPLPSSFREGLSLLPRCAGRPRAAGRPCRAGDVRPRRRRRDPAAARPSPLARREVVPRLPQLGGRRRQGRRPASVAGRRPGDGTARRRLLRARCPTHIEVFPANFAGKSCPERGRGGRARTPGRDSCGTRR